MHDLVLTLHSLVRWAIVLVGVVAVARAWMGWRGNRLWAQLDDRLGVIFTSVMDLNLLLGLLLYFVLSPITTSALRDMGAAMSTSYLRFFTVEHTLVMLIAVVVAHVGRSRSKKAADDRGKFKQAAIFFTVAMALVLLAIPWPFLSAGAGRGWL